MNMKKKLNELYATISDTRAEITVMATLRSIILPNLEAVPEFTTNRYPGHAYITMAIPMEMESDDCMMTVKAWEDLAGTSAKCMLHRLSDHSIVFQYSNVVDSVIHYYTITLELS